MLTAFKPSNVARGLEAARRPPDQAQIDAAVAQLAPEQRAAYEANMARVEAGRAEAQAAWEQAAAVNDEARILDGPAGDHLYGPGMRAAGSPAQLEAQIAQQGLMGMLGAAMGQASKEFGTAVKQTLNRDVVPQEQDPARRAQIAAAERAARDHARAPYRAPDAPDVRFARIATRGKTQLAELLDFLATSGLAARPDLVFGVHRVPDRISGPLTPHSEQGRVVEWEVVHAPLPPATGAATTKPEVTSFLAADRWVARRHGEPSVLDEDLALAFCHAAGLGPERCLGLARFSEVRELRGGESEPLRPIVRGIVALHAPAPAGAFADFAARAPHTDLAAPGVHVEVLNWLEVARAVRPKIHHPPPVPAPFAYLPDTPQELLQAYLEVVGVQPHDCWSAQATFDRPRALEQGGLMTTNLGPKQPCADGEWRQRTHACEHVVLVYRDSPEYAAGRERWDAYQRDVLQARIRGSVALRPPVHAQDDDLDGIPTPVLRGAIRAAETWDKVWNSDWGAETVPPYRYCRPPA